MPNLLRLEWERDADGYQLVEVQEDYWEDDSRAGPQHFSTEVTPWAAALIDDVGGRALMVGPFPSSPLSFLVPKGKSTLRYDPLDKHPALFREFADVERTPRNVNAFADKYGLLFGSEAVELVDPWYSEIEQMQAAVKMWETGRERGNLNPLIKVFNESLNVTNRVQFGQSPYEKRPALYITPTSLRDAMWLQLAQAVSANTQLRRCLWCPAWFTFGVGTGRRKSAHYCSDKCRKAAHMHQKESGS